MIYTITLNPAIDRIISSDDFSVGKTNYYSKTYDVIGGKGINVSIMLSNLDKQTVATGFFGKENSKVFEDKLAKTKIKEHFIKYDGATRINYKIKDFKNKTETELNGKGSKISDEYLDSLLNWLKENVTEQDIVVASGSVPSGVRDDIYQLIGNVVNENKAKFVMDTSKIWLKEGIKAKPYVIKPNMDEVIELLGLEDKDYSQEQEDGFIEQIKKMGARNVLVSNGSHGSTYYSEDGNKYIVSTPQGKFVNSVGAGDSMVAGYVYGVSEGLSVEDTLKYAAACGASTAFTEWIGEKDAVLDNFKKIEVKKA